MKTLRLIWTAVQAHMWLAGALLAAGFFLGGAVIADEKGLFGPIVASWIQAIGSIGAIVGAIYIERKAAKRAELRLDQDERASLYACRDVVDDVCRFGASLLLLYERATPAATAINYYLLPDEALDAQSEIVAAITVRQQTINLLVRQPLPAYVLVNLVQAEHQTRRFVDNVPRPKSSFHRQKVVDRLTDSLGQLQGVRWVLDPDQSYSADHSTISRRE